MQSLKPSALLLAFVLCLTTLVGARPAPSSLVADNSTLPIIFLRPAYYQQDANELPLTYNDRGSGANLDITVWTPTNTLTTGLPFKALGSLGVGNYGSPSDNLQWQTAWLATPGTPGSLANPVDYTQIWNDHVRTQWCK